MSSFATSTPSSSSSLWSSAHGPDRAKPHWQRGELIAMIVGFVLFWPIGLAVLAFKLFGGRIPPMMAERLPAWLLAPVGCSKGRDGSHAMTGQGPSHPISGDLASHSGNSAFEDYKRATLERLEAERRKLEADQRDFGAFLDSLKTAKDREEFERFMEARAREKAFGDEAADIPRPAPTS